MMIAPAHVGKLPKADFPLLGGFVGGVADGVDEGDGDMVGDSVADGVAAADTVGELLAVIKMLGVDDADTEDEAEDEAEADADALDDGTDELLAAADDEDVPVEVAVDDIELVDDIDLEAVRGRGYV